MSTGPTNRVIDHLRRAVLPGGGAALGDDELLGDFIERHDEAALAGLVKRHGPMVWGVCRRLLNHHDAEDAFQATFIVLVRKAASIAPRAMVGNWLYGVAHQSALQARRTATRRRAREVQVQEMPDTASLQPDQWPDLRPLLDQELSRLPDNYRVVIVLCDLEGRTRKEVARQLRVPEGTMAGRLTRARTMLAKRLARRGVTLSGGAVAAVIAQNVASAGVPISVVSSTMQAATLVAAGKRVATGALSAKVVALTEGVLRAMLMTKLKVAIAILLVIGFVTTGATLLSDRSAAAQDKAAIAKEQVKSKSQPKNDKEPITAWGKEVGGLQAGIGFRSGAQRTYSHGETVMLVVRLRNVGTEEVTFRDVIVWMLANPLTVTDSNGKAVQVSCLRPVMSNGKLGGSTRLPPGKAVEYDELHVQLKPLSARDDPPTDMTLFGTGKFQVQYRADGMSSLGRIGNQTGKLELEVREPMELPPAKEAFTAWGKESSGLQAGLGFHPGAKRAYAPGETVKLVVRVRNISKEVIKFQYLKEFFIETPPTVTDGKSKPVLLGRRDAGGLVHVPVEVNLAPGKEIELAELKLDPRTQTQSVHPGQWNLFETGTFSVRYEQLAVPTVDKILSKLATGRLELDITFSAPAATGTVTPPQEERKDAASTPIKIRVYIEKVNVDTSTITASCVLIGEVDGVTKPLRFENLRVADKAKITDRGKDVSLTDLKLLPRATHFHLFLKVCEEELGFEVVGIETIRK